MQDAFIVDAVRTPFGAHEGVFSETHPQDLGIVPLLSLEERNEFVPAEDIEDVFYGVVNPVDEQAKTVGRLVSLLSGWGDSVPGIQLDRTCGSGQQAVNSCAAEVRAGFADVMIGGGLEHMTRVPMGSNGSWSDVSATYFEHFDELPTQGEAAERIAEQGGYDRRELDRIAVDSQERCAEAWEAGYYDGQVVPVDATTTDGKIRVNTDEHPSPRPTSRRSRTSRSHSETRERASSTRATHRESWTGQPPCSSPAVTPAKPTAGTRWRESSIRIRWESTRSPCSADRSRRRTYSSNRTTYQSTTWTASR